MNKLVTALTKVIAAKEIQTSGNLEDRVRKMGPKVREAVADGYHESNAKPEDVFQSALDLGRDIREDTVYGMEIDRMWYYFVGTENDIIRKLEEVSDTGEEVGDEVKDAIEDLDKEL